MRTWSGTKARQDRNEVIFEKCRTGTARSVALFFISKKLNGAPNQTNLEPASLHSILDELEEWEAFLKTEPELIHKLQSFDEATKPSQKPTSPARPRGPSL